MKTLPAAMSAIIADGDFTGPQKAVARVTINPDPFLGIYPVENYPVDRDGRDKVQQVYSSLPFRAVSVHAKELPNVKSINWNRSTKGDIGSCTIELWNTKPLPPGTGPDKGDSFDYLGYYTYNRGKTSYSQTTWGHDVNEWRNVLLPDSMITTYQGYGVPDYDTVPESDPCVVQTGVWLIDDVTYTADGLITLECRDAGRLLADQISFPPVVPLPLYPQQWEQYNNYQPPPKEAEVATGWVRPAYDTSGNFVYIGDAPVSGHHGVDAFDTQDSTYWLSTGNSRPNQGYSFEYLQGKVSGISVGAAKCKVWGGPYRVWLSVRSGGVWQGTKIVPYDPNNPASGPNGSNIPYVKEGRVAKDGTVTFSLPKAIENVDAVRFTFTDLYNSGIGPFRYRAGVRDMQVSGTKEAMVAQPLERHGNYGDYSEIVKMLLAWGGFYWPQNGKMYLTDTNTETYAFGSHDPFLFKGRIWGDIEMSGTRGRVKLDVQVWDKKPLLDCIGYIKDILGFIFFVDENGAAQWRSPNTFRLGNWKTDVNGLNLTRTSQFITVRDSEAILGLRSKLSSRNIRDNIFVANVNGKTGAVSEGRVATGGFRRVGGWTDQNFETADECQVMADMITLRQMFTYRQNSIRIPANPAIQIDDQIQLEERTTGEAYKHYVSAISSQWDLEKGVWSYDLTTSWLGEEPSGIWAFKTDGLAQATIDYLTALGQV